MAKRRKRPKKVKTSERLVRLVLAGVVILALVGGVKALADWRAKNPSEGKPLDLPELSLDELPTREVLGEILEEKIQISREGQVEQEEEPEPVTEPVENIQVETQTLIESIKKLPEDQIEAIKKQIFKEFCEDYCQEVEEENEETES